jgi:hypothetical protein
MRPIQRVVPTFIAALLAVTVVASGSNGVRGAVGTMPFISEYVEGPSGTFAKALEIYNPTASPVDLTLYNVMVFTNGSTTPSTIPLTGTLAAGDVHVLANPSSVAAVLAAADQQNAGLDFNGNDMIVLQRGDTGQFVDAIGQLAVDPGISGWGTPPLNTTDAVLRRKPSVSAGDSVPTDVFDPAAEWDVASNTDFSGLGTHSVDGDTGGSSSGTVNADVTMAAAAACLELSATSISFGTLGFGAEDAPASPSLTLTNCATVPGTLLASATDAVGTTANWTLVDSAATCADTLGTDAFRLNLQSPDLAGPLGLGTDSKTVQSLAAGASTTHTAHIYTPCPGSSGDGETLTFQVNYLATE